MSARVKIYTKDPCPYCVRAIRLMDEYGIAYQEIDLTGQQDEIDRIKNETGWRTVPVILIDDQLVGGYDDLKVLFDQGKLKELMTKS